MFEFTQREFLFFFPVKPAEHIWYWLPLLQVNLEVLSVLSRLKVSCLLAPIEK